MSLVLAIDFRSCKISAAFDFIPSWGGVVVVQRQIKISFPHFPKYFSINSQFIARFRIAEGKSQLSIWLRKVTPSEHWVFHGVCVGAWFPCSKATLQNWECFLVKSSTERFNTEENHSGNLSRCLRVILWLELYWSLPVGTVSGYTVWAGTRDRNWWGFVKMSVHFSLVPWVQICGAVLLIYFSSVFSYHYGGRWKPICSITSNNNKKNL